jgi:hypothetical protein
MNNQPVTRNDVKLVIAVATVIIAVVLAWADIKNMAANAVEEASLANKKVDSLAVSQNDMALDVREIKTALKLKDIISQEPEPTISSPLMAGQSAVQPPEQITYNYYASVTPGTVKESFIAEPTRQPEPTAAPAATPTPQLCVLVICL